MTKNWLYKIEGTDTPIATANEPTFGKVSTTGDYYLGGIWYNLNGVAYTTPITYLPIVAWIDDQSNIVDIDSYDIPTLNETSIKADVVNSDLYKGKQVCTAWCNFDGSTTPPTIRDSYNVSQVIRTGTGIYEVYFKESMENTNYTVNISNGYNAVNNNFGNVVEVLDFNKFKFKHWENNIAYNISSFLIQIFGGKD